MEEKRKLTIREWFRKYILLDDVKECIIESQKAREEIRPIIEQQRTTINGEVEWFTRSRDEDVNKI